MSHVYVIGLGHVGLPMACWFALHGHRVQGVDISEAVVEAILSGKVKMAESLDGLSIAQIARALTVRGELAVSTRLDRKSAEPSIFIVTVGLSDGSPDAALSPLDSALDAMIPLLADGDLVMMRSTLIPGTCEDRVAPRLKASGRRVHLSYCPETMAETHAFEELAHNPVILACQDEEGFAVAETFLRSLSEAPIHRADTLTTAELAKVVQNIARDVDIALANEVSDAAMALGVRPRELWRLVNTHPRVKLLHPGPGVGGYCLPNALSYLLGAFQDRGGTSLEVIRTARSLNDRRPREVAGLVKRALSDAGKDLSGSRVAVLGLAMKEACADMRCSPAIAIIDALLSLGAGVRAYDPLVQEDLPYRAGSLAECLEGADCLVIAVNQPGVELDPGQIRTLLAYPPLVVDTRDCFADCEGVQIYRF